MEEEKNKILKKISQIQKEAGKFLKLFVLLFLVTIIVINWGTIKGMFDYKGIYGEMLNSLKTELRKQKELALKVPQVKLSKPEFEYTDKPDSLEIPGIEITVPFILSETSEKGELEKLLKQGVVFYPESVLPGKEGVTVVLGHSAPSNWPKINYDWAFTRLNELKPEDEVFVYFKHRKYPYRVTKKIFLNKGDEIPFPDISNGRSVLMMLSCWPPGIDNKRIAVQAELQL